MVSKARRWIGAISLVAVFNTMVAMPAVAIPETDRATLLVLNKEMELLKLNTIYRMESTKQSKWKPWRTSFFNLAQFGTSFSGITTLAASRWQYWRSPQVAPKHLFQTGPILLLIGHSVGLGGVALEATLDAINDRKLKRKGLDRKSYLAKVASLKAGINNSLVERARLAATIEPSEAALFDAETRVLQSNLDSGLAEASRYAVRHKRAVVGRHVGNIMATAGLTTGGYVGALMSTLSARYKKPHYAGSAGLGFTLSGAFIVLGPLVARAAQNFAVKRTAKQIAEEIGPINANAPAELAASTTSFRALVSASPAETAARRAEQMVPIMEATEKMVAQQVAMGQAEAKQNKKEWVERVVVSSIIGGTKMGYGIQLMNAGYSFPEPKVARGGRNAVQTFHLRIASGATTFIPGLSTGILDTLQSRIRGEIKSRKLIAENKSPNQILQKRLDDITELQSKLADHLQDKNPYD